MLTVLYTFFIAPLELFMTTVLDWGYGLFASYGWSIVLMSLVVNTVILPIYNKAEGWQEEERAVKKSFEATEAMIKRTFKGQERFAMLTTMRRQAGYSSKLALRSSLGFFLQIPFFIAAYHLLSNMAALKGVSFGPIADLGAADGLIAIGDWHINALPLIMTAVNLLSAFVYTARLTKQDKIQLYGLSALFLVLLYASPAALTFYWTLNNVYSLGKNIVEKSLLPRWRATKHVDPFAGLKTFGEKRRWVLGILGVLLIAADTAITAENLPRASLDGLRPFGLGFLERSLPRTRGQRPRDGEGPDDPRLRFAMDRGARLPRHDGGVGAHSEGAAGSRLDDGGRWSRGAYLCAVDASSRRRLCEALALRA